jgi:hypothetical protein
MSFSPYTRYVVGLPVLRPGNILAIGGDFYMIITVRENRKLVALTGLQTKYPLALDSGPSFESLHGNLKKNRVVNILYVAIDQSNTPELFWGTEPLQSKDVDDTMSTVLDGISNPLMINRWSYDQSMRLLVTESATQNYYFEIIEYEIVAYAGTPPRPYWQILQNGQAILVEDAATQAALKAMSGK